jgi:hypothetical protein
MKKIIQVIELVRKTFGYEGVVLCDDGIVYRISLVRNEATGHWDNTWTSIHLEPK